jgi:hypothetical protein
MQEPFRVMWRHKLFSNTLGVALDAGIQRGFGKTELAHTLRAQSHGDYLDGKQQSCLQFAFRWYSGQDIALGWRKGNWLSENNYMFSLNHFGFLMEADMEGDSSQSRWSRDFQDLNHTVIFNILTSENTIFKAIQKSSSTSVLTLTTGRNRRAETRSA